MFVQVLLDVNAKKRFDANYWRGILDAQVNSLVPGVCMFRHFAIRSFVYLRVNRLTNAFGTRRSGQG